MSKNFLGAPYPILATPQGLLPTTFDVDQIKADMLILLLTNPGERVMLPTFGTDLRKLMFEQADDIIVAAAQKTIADSLAKWEPRVQINQVFISIKNEDVLPHLAHDDDKSQIDHIMVIVIEFIDPGDIDTIQQLYLELPLGGG